MSAITGAIIAISTITMSNVVCLGGYVPIEASTLILYYPLSVRVLVSTEIVSFGPAYALLIPLFNNVESSLYTARVIG